jgi:TPR repeat protein
VSRKNPESKLVLRPGTALSLPGTRTLANRGLEELEAIECSDTWLEKADEYFSEYVDRMSAFLGSRKINFLSKRYRKAHDAWLNSDEQLASMKAYIDCLNRAVNAKPGYPKALMKVAEAYLNGWGVPQNRVEALQLLRDATAGADPDDMWKMIFVIRLEDNGVDPWPEGMKEAERMCRIAAEQGHAGAQYSLGEMYVKGEGGLPCDDELALFWFKRAAENGEFPPAEGQLQYWKSKRAKISIGG